MIADPKTYDALSSIVLVVGFYEGLVPFGAKLVDLQPVLSLPARMSSPAWWVVSVLVLVLTVVSLDALDRAKAKVS